jgi:DNA-binding SARP family transcriptional activator/tetratricopeptide (TPR) repeat protein
MRSRQWSAIAATTLRAARRGAVYAAPMLRIRVLGELELEADGAPVDPPAGRPARALLGWLALHPGTHARSTVAARLWPDVRDTSARKSLRTALSSLRTAVGPAARQALVATRETVGLAGEPEVWVDARSCEALIAEGRHEDALELCHGELLPGFDDDWVLVLRDEHRRRRGAALQALEEAAERAGDHHRAVRMARSRAALDPFDELAHRDLMRRLAAAGDRAGALIAYERLAERLRRELAVAPSGETRRLAAALREPKPPAAGAPRPARTQAGAPPKHPAPALPARLAALRRPAPLVGRDASLARLRAFWARVRAGERQVALLSGEPGIGKTRLAAELARELHAEGAAVLYGRAEEESLLPYQPFVEALRDALSRAEVALPAEADELVALLPELEDRLPGGAQGRHGAAAAGQAVGLADRAGARLRFFEAVAAAIEAAAQHRPLLLMLDDLHWADRPTLRLLVYLTGRAGPAPALVLAAYRETDIGEAHPLREALADVRRELTVEHLPLEGLAADDVAALVERSLGRPPETSLVRALHEKTGGNPFFIAELLHGLDKRGLERIARDRADVPEGAAQAIARRVGRLGASAVGVLTAGAIAGPEFDLDVVAEVAGLPPDTALDVLDAAVRARILDEVEPGRYVFVHALARDALTGPLTGARTARLHGLIAASLEARAEQHPDRYLTPLAHHALEAASTGDPERAVELADRAAARAVAVHAHEDAADLLERAIGVLNRRGGAPRRRGELLCALGHAHERAGTTELARAAFDRASELARTLGDVELLARAALGAAGIGVTILKVDRLLVERLEDALSPLGEEHSALRIRLLAQLAIALAYDSDERRREELSRAAVELARCLADDGSLAAALGARHVALWDPDHTHARLDCATEMLELARRAGDRELALQARNWRVLDLFELGDGAAVRSELDAYAALAAEVRLPALSWYVPVWRATLAVLGGRLEEGLELARRARELGRRAGDANADVFWQELRHTRQMADQRFDEDQDLLPYVEHKAEHSPAGWAYRATLAWTYAELGREDEARRHLDTIAADTFTRIPRDMNWLPAMASATEAAAVLGDEGQAATLRRLLEPYRALTCVSGRGAGHYGSVAYLLARLAATVGDLAAADELYTEAARRDERAGALIWVVRDLRHHGALLLAQGDPRRAHDVLRRAAEGARKAGLERTLEATRRTLAAVR